VNTKIKSVGGMLVAALFTQGAGAVTINFDYSLDTNGFFSSQARKDVLQSAGNFFGNRLTDHLTAISSSGSNQFNAKFSDPGTGNSATSPNFSVAADTLTIFVGGRSLGGALGLGGPGGFSCSGFGTFCADAASRGQGVTSGPGATDFGPWGGSISFDNTATWYFDPDTSTDESFTGFDFYSVALHEIGHVLGVGTADSWFNQTSGNQFTGSHSVAVHGGNVPLNTGSDHWASGTTSPINGTGSFDVAMAPSIAAGQRKRFTDLDVAALQDIGWQVTTVPLPPAAALMLGGLLMGGGVWRKRRA